jgi:hypothetical protein
MIIIQGKKPDPSFPYFCPISEITFDTFKKLVVGSTVQPHSSAKTVTNKRNPQGKTSKLSTFEEGLLHAMCIALPGIYVNNNLNSQVRLQKIS